MNGVLKYQRLTFLWALFILVMCSISMGNIPKAHIFFPGFDKLAHCGFFFVLPVLMCDGLIRRYGKSYLSVGRGLLIILICIAYGGLIELLQAFFFTWRSGEWDDLFADTVGTCMAIFGILVTLFAVDHEKS